MIEKTPEQLFRRGMALLNAGNTASAAANFDAAVRRARSTGIGRAPGKYVSYYGLAMAAAYGPSHEYISACERAVRWDPHEADLQLNLGRVYLLAQKTTRALAAFERGLRVEPGHTGLQKMIANVDRRSRPVIARLGRDHAVNRSFGRLRAALRPRSLSE